VSGTQASAAAHGETPSDGVVEPLFRIDPASCAGRIDPDQRWLPEWLAFEVDHHVWPSASPWAIAGKARTVCEHVNWAQIWSEHPEVFQARQQVGAPPPEVLWDAKRKLAELGTELCFEVQLEDVGDGAVGVAIYGAGVVGRLSPLEWQTVAELLTTCTARVRQPRRDVDLQDLVRPARPAIQVGRHRPIAGVRPVSWEIGDWMHTWWSYPLVGTLRDNCHCPAHTPESSSVHFGPSGLRAVAS
jgi:hypothetical protein